MLNFESALGAREDGGRPRSWRCAGVRGMSARLSLGRKRGMKARPIWTTGMSWIMVHVQVKYNMYLRGMLRSLMLEVEW